MEGERSSDRGRERGGEDGESASHIYKNIKHTRHNILNPCNEIQCIC